MHIKIHTEYSFRFAFGSINKILDCIQWQKFAGICDRNGTWGHLAWDKKCRSRGIKPIFGVELAVVASMDERTRQPVNWMSFIALNNDGLKEIHQLVSIATEKFYHHPRIDFSIVNRVSENLVILSGDNLVLLGDCPPIIHHPNFYLELSPTLLDVYIYKFRNCKKIISCNNFYPAEFDKQAYEIAIDVNAQDMLHDMHIHLPKINISEEEFILALENNNKIAESANVTMPIAEMVKPQTQQTFDVMCYKLAKAKGIDFEDEKYKTRFQRELSVIKQKQFEDYFFVVYDLVQYAKLHMLVGPARGSSCGSLICYILGITEIDPIKYDLLFERFIDINRSDLPDIDIDFPDTKRNLIIKYLKKKYGHDCVAKLGTINTFKSFSALGFTAKDLNIPLYKLEKFKNALTEKPIQPFKTILETSFKLTNEGFDLLSNYPAIIKSCELEGAIRHGGVHAAGIVVTNKPVTDYCSVSENTGSIQLDKHEAEQIGLLKIDVLGLKTLSVLETTLKMVGLSREDLMSQPLDNPLVYQLIKENKFSGVFQFEGNALRNICAQMRVENFDDIAAVTALARPGPLQCGGTQAYVRCKNGDSEPVYIHDIVKNETQNTFGVIVYQEQVMQIARNVGKMSWPEVSALRKAIGKSLGSEHFETFFEKFKIGALENGLTLEQISDLWGNMRTMGAYAFNKSHAVAYAVLSYWCMYLKANYPLEYACACLQNAKSEEQSISVLRELVLEGYQYKTFDAEKSQLTWSVADGILIGGLTNIKGVGIKTAEEILRCRDNNEPYNVRQKNILESGLTPYDSLFETKQKWSHIFADPEKYNIVSKISNICDITVNSIGEFVIIGKAHSLLKKNINSNENISNRGGKVLSGESEYLVFKMEDDTSEITCVIGRYDFKNFGKEFLLSYKENDYFLIKGTSQEEFKTLSVKTFRKLTGNKVYQQ